MWVLRGARSPHILTELFAFLLLLVVAHSVMSYSVRPHGLQHARLPCPSLYLRVCSNSMSIKSMMPSNHLILYCLLLLLSSFNLFQYQSLFQWVDSLHQVAKVLELQLQHQSFQWIFRVDLGCLRVPQSSVGHSATEKAQADLDSNHSPAICW